MFQYLFFFVQENMVLILVMSKSHSGAPKESLNDVLKMSRWKTLTFTELFEKGSLVRCYLLRKISPQKNTCSSSIKSE